VKLGGSLMRPHQGLQTTEARGREEGCGGRRRRISRRRSSTSSGGPTQPARCRGSVQRPRLTRMELGMQPQAGAAGHSVSNLTRLDLRTAARAALVVHSGDVLGVDLGWTQPHRGGVTLSRVSACGFVRMGTFSFLRLWSSTGAHQHQAVELI
jgi:hypothetical protein